jgi:hypothetical protein
MNDRSTSEQTKLREAFSKITRGRGQRYPAELRARAVKWAKAERSTGAGWEAIASAIGVHGETVRVWCSEGSNPRMRRVHVTRDAKTRTVRLVSPSGYRIEDLTLEDAAMLIAKLG